MLILKGKVNLESAIVLCRLVYYLFCELCYDMSSSTHGGVPSSSTTALKPDENLQLCNKKHKTERDNHTVKVVEEIMIDATTTEPPKSFRDALMKAFGEKGDNEESLSDMLNEDIPENK